MRALAKRSWKPADMTISNPQEVADAGERIYQQKYKTSLEKEHPGQFVAIDVKTEKIYVAPQPEAALQQAKAEAPTGVFHLIRVGAPGAYRVSHVNTASSPNRIGLFRPHG